MAGEPAPTLKVFSCPQCGASVQLRAVGQSMSAVCSSCFSVIDTSDENYKILSQSISHGKRTQLIPLGARGRLHGTLWEVIGYMERSDFSGAFVWSEYLLFNPLKGFRWLTEFDGHWNYVIMTKSQPTALGQTVDFLGKTYHLFHRGEAKVVYVVGEFYWRAQVGEEVKVHDYIRPPEILSQERSQTETVWSSGEYIEPEKVKTAFSITQQMPTPYGVAPNQPSTIADEASVVLKAWGTFVGVIFMIQFALMLSTRPVVLTSGEYDHIGSSPDHTNSTPSFTLEKGSSNLDIELYANVDNRWLEIQGELVNDNTGEESDFSTGVEYYSGYDSDGSWAEGSRWKNLTISAVPAGTYHINFESSAENYSQNTHYRVHIRSGILTWSNFFWSLVLVSIYPLIVYLLRRSFEVDRWSQSNFSPYYHQGDD
jgi:hypothetical protein